uniref:Ig-like domain-containing protein n=1 Tax=Petromyzon marinus TaxID=7757 RepID=S4RHA4_PETMA
ARPTVVRGATTVSVAAGRPLSLPCTASGWPEPAVSWALPGDGGQLLPNQRSGAGSGARVFANGTLLVPAAMWRDAGTYKCTAANVAGVDSAAVIVTVLGPPRVAAPPPGDVAVPYGGALRLRCVAEGEPRPVVVWRLPSASPPPSADRRMRVLPDGSLALDGVVASDAGRYVCTVRNRHGEDSATATVSINQAPQIQDKPERAVVRITSGDSIALECRASGDPAPLITWRLPDGSVPHSSGRLLTHANGSLEIRSAARSDAGRYACVARGADGSRDARLSVDLTVMGAPAPPSFLAPTTERVEVAPGASVALACPARGEPPPQTTWTLPGGAQLARGSNRGARFSAGLDGALLVRGATLADTGVYRCSARSPSGVADRVVLLEVGPQPRITPPAVVVLRGAPLRLPCMASGAPVPEVRWERPDGARL